MYLVNVYVGDRSIFGRLTIRCYITVIVPRVPEFVRAEMSGVTRLGGARGVLRRGNVDTSRMDVEGVSAYFHTTLSRNLDSSTV